MRFIRYNVRTRRYEEGDDGQPMPPPPPPTWRYVIAKTIQLDGEETIIHMHTFTRKRKLSKLAKEKLKALGFKILEEVQE